MLTTSLSPRLTPDHVLVNCEESIAISAGFKVKVERIFFARVGSPLEVQFDHRKCVQQGEHAGYLAEDPAVCAGANALLQKLGYLGAPLECAELGKQSEYHLTLLANDEFLAFAATKGWWTHTNLCNSTSLF